MTCKQFRGFLNAQPFEPFVINLTNGRRIPVLSRELVAISPSGRNAAVYQRDDKADFIDMTSVSSLAPWKSTSESTKIKRLRKVIRQRPFEPFALQLMNGQELAITNQEIVMLSPNGKSVAIWLTEVEAFRVVSLNMIAKIRLEGLSKKQPKRKSGS